MTEWSSDPVTEWPSDQVTEWPSNQVTKWQEASQTIDRMVWNLHTYMYFIVAVRWFLWTNVLNSGYNWFKASNGVSIFLCRSIYRQTSLQHVCIGHFSIKTVWYVQRFVTNVYEPRHVPTVARCEYFPSLVYDCSIVEVRPLAANTTPHTVIHSSYS